MNLLIITSFNQLEYTKRIWDNIRKKYSNSNNHVLFVDDCSDDGTQDWLKEISFNYLITKKKEVG